MRCIYCDEELAANSVFCPKCGKEVQFVTPDILLEDEYIDSLIAGKTDSPQKDISQSEKNNHKKQIRIVFLLTAIVLFFLLIMLIVWIGKSGQKSSYDYQIKMGRECLETHDYEAAIGYYEAAIKLMPEDGDTRATLADLYKKMNKEDAALVAYLDLIQLQPDNQRAYEEVIQIYERRGDTEGILRLRDSVEVDAILPLFAAYDTQVPLFNYEEGEYEEFIDVALYTSDGSSIYYTLDRTNPVEYGVKYTGPIPLHELKSYTISAVARSEGGSYSEVVTKEYGIHIPAPQLPVVSPDGGEYTTETYVTVQVPEGCVAYYTWDGSDPNTMSTQYTDALVIPSGNHVLSVVVVDTMTGLNSEIYRQYFTYYP